MRREDPEVPSLGSASDLMRILGGLRGQAQGLLDGSPCGPFTQGCLGAGKEPLIKVNGGPPPHMDILRPPDMRLGRRALTPFVSMSGMWGATRKR